jgi:hypothetical protein
LRRIMHNSMSARSISQIGEDAQAWRGRKRSSHAAAPAARFGA